MPSPLRNGDAPPPRLPSPAVGRHPHHFHSTVSEQKIRRLNALILLLRLAAFCFSLVAAIFMGTNSSRSPGSPSWLQFRPFRYSYIPSQSLPFLPIYQYCHRLAPGLLSRRLVFAVNAIVAAYSLFAMGLSIWEILKGATLFPEPLQLWFDFAHDQVFAYLVLAAEAAGTVEARELKGAHACTLESAFCVQADISVALGFVGFVFLTLSALVSGFRLACHVITGFRFHL
ncbi:CASP-like protein 4C1 isoform X1 [Elaeis guineensis]|uniref:CASP-like protein 4C1 isoform X1 n=1 Tax=Elaeis guineensis var. tenera TaxID=51953 RepID=UPI003C6DAD49